MAYHGVLIPSAIMATNIDSLNRSMVSGSPIDNGMVVVMGNKSGVAGNTEVFMGTLNASTSATNMWMAYQADEVVSTGNYKGLDPDVRNFYVSASKVFSAYKPQVGDIIVMTADSFVSGYSASLTYANATAGEWKLKWEATQPTNGLSYKYIKTTYISLAEGNIGDQRVTAYQVECLAN